MPAKSPNADSDAARGERMRYRLETLLGDPWTFLPSYAERYGALLQHAGTLTPHQAYAMTELFGRDSSRYFPDMPQTAELQFPKVNAVDAQSQVGWYYFAGHCEGADGKRYGVLCMLFRNALMPPVMAEHFGLNDTDNQLVEVQLAVAVEGGRFYQVDPPVTAGTSGKVRLADKLCLVTGGGSAESETDSLFPLRVQASGTDRSAAKPVDMAIDLTITSGRTYLPQGFDGAEPLIGGLGTRYYSIPGLIVDPARSTLTLDGQTIALKSGTLWFDHQWGLGLAPTGSPRQDVLRATANLSPSKSLGWDFFVANFFDGPRSLTLNSIHNADSARFLNQTGDKQPGTLTAPVVGKYMDPFGVLFNISGLLEIDDWRKTGPAPDPAKYPNTPTWVPHHWIFTLTEGVVPENLRKLEARAICDDANALQFANGARYVEAAIDYFGADGTAVGTGYAEAVGYLDALVTRLSLAGLPTTPESQALFREGPIPLALWLESVAYMLSPANQAEFKRLTACAQFAPGPRPLDCASPAPAAPAPADIHPDDILAALKEHFGKG